jgi:hypothetical protein
VIAAPSCCVSVDRDAIADERPGRADRRYAPAERRGRAVNDRPAKRTPLTLGRAKREVNPPFLSLYLSS